MFKNLLIGISVISTTYGYVVHDTVENKVLKSGVGKLRKQRNKK